MLVIGQGRQDKVGRNVGGGVVSGERCIRERVRWEKEHK